MLLKYIRQFLPAGRVGVNVLNAHIALKRFMLVDFNHHICFSSSCETES